MDTKLTYNLRIRSIASLVTRLLQNRVNKFLISDLGKVFTTFCCLHEGEGSLGLGALCMTTRQLQLTFLIFLWVQFFSLKMVLTFQLAYSKQSL